MEKTTLVSRVLAFLKGGDEAKLTRFSTKLEKYFSKQISMREEEIENLKEKITDAQEEMGEKVLNVDIERITSTDNTENYVVDYVEKVAECSEKIADLEKNITYLQEEITTLRRIAVIIFPE